MKKAIVTGITGQDGAYLAELLLLKGYAVYGTYRRTSSVNFWRIEELGIDGNPNLHLLEYDLTDFGASISLLQKVQPDEIYNLAAQSFVGSHLSSQMLQLKLLVLVRLICWRPFALLIWIFDFTRRVPPKCLGKSRVFHRWKARRFIRAARMA